ncbi:hypothetical protein [Actinophytocola sp. KF-1]
MPDGFRIDPETVAQAGSALTKAGTELSTAKAGPEGVDAGNLTDVFQRLAGKLAVDANQVAIGLEAAGAELAKTSRDYVTQDQREKNRYPD